MAATAENVTVAITGAIAMGTVGGTLPADSEATLPVGLTDLGYVSEDGITETRDRDTNTITAWQNGDTVREVVTSATLSFQFTLLETKAETVELFYGNTLNDATGGIPIVPARTGGRRMFVIDVVDGENLIRIVIPSGEVTEVGDMSYVNGDPIGYDVTITAYPSATIKDTNGNNAAAIKYFSALATGA